jgi:DNA primase
VVLCEAPLDALTFWVNGIRNVTFFHGTGGFPDCLLDALLENRVRTIRLAYRADEAGNRAAARDAELLTARGIECFRVRFPWGMDANGYAQHQAAVALREGLATPAVKTLRVAVDAAEWMEARSTCPQSAPPRRRLSMNPRRPAKTPLHPLRSRLPSARPPR